MVLDRNPLFGADESFQSSARRVADMLWEATKGNPQSIPDNYLKNFRHEYSDGAVSFLGNLNKVTLHNNTYEEYCEVVDALLHTYAEDWPSEDSIVEIQAEKLLYEIEPEAFNLDFDFDFAEPSDMSDKMELFLKKVISSVYLDGVSKVTDEQGNPPNLANRYLMSPDNKSFSGTFYDEEPGEKSKKFNFEITGKKDGSWEILY